MTHAPSAALIELRDVRRSHVAPGGSQAVASLRGVSLTIEAGEFVAIVGASGSGKSTLMNILGCLDRPTSGQYLVAGRDVMAATPQALAHLRRECFGFVFQHYHLLPARSALENVMLPGLYSRMTLPVRRERALELLQRLGLSERRGHRPGELSGGQQQRVAIARALMNGGRVILADEPTGALDSKTGAEVMQLLRQLWLDGHTVIVVTHSADVARCANRVIELHDGAVVADRVQGDERAAPIARDAHERASRSACTAALAGVRETLAAAGQSLRERPARTFLTLLGVMTGVAAVVALLAIGEGAKQAVLAEMSAFGTNRLYVFPGGENARGPGGVLTESDADVVRDVPNVAAAMPYLKGPVTVRFANVDHQSSGVAITSDFPAILNWKVDSGSFFTPDDERGLATVAVLGCKLARTLFPDDDDPLGRFVLVNDVPFQVVGVLSEKGAATGDADDDDTIVFPFSTGSQRIFGTPYLSWISVLVEDFERASETEQAIEADLTDKHRMKDFEVYNKAAAIAARTQTMNMLTALLALTAAISLVVGGVGVMNIMLMTVTERTSEIGVRMAVGASPRDVLYQFLIEAVALSALGGALGLVVGAGLGIAARALDMPVLFRPEAAVAAFACACFTGIASGYAPALRAARLDPVAALARN